VGVPVHRATGVVPGGQALPTAAEAGRSVRKPFPAWAEYKPNSLWIYDTTHFTAAGMAVLIVEDLVSRIFRT
jgi:hypothetical protein